MNNNRLRNYRNANALRSQKLVSNMLRTRQISTPPQWALVKSRGATAFNRSVNPPPYNDDSVYQRKVRIVHSNNLNNIITVKQLQDAAGVGSIFHYVAVDRIEAWGAHSDGTAPMLRVQPAFPISATGSHPNSRDFIDIGTTGASKSHLAITLGEKDIKFFSASTVEICKVGLLNEEGAPVLGQVIIDLWCRFRGTNTSVFASSHSYAPSLLDEVRC